MKKKVKVHNKLFHAPFTDGTNKEELSSTINQYVSEGWRVVKIKEKQGTIRPYIEITFEK